MKYKYGARESNSSLVLNDHLIKKIKYLNYFHRNPDRIVIIAMTIMWHAWWLILPLVENSCVLTIQLYNRHTLMSPSDQLYLYARESINVNLSSS